MGPFVAAFAKKPGRRVPEHVRSQASGPGLTFDGSTNIYTRTTDLCLTFDPSTEDTTNGTNYIFTIEQFEKAMEPQNLHKSRGTPSTSRRTCGERLC